MIEQIEQSGFERAVADAESAADIPMAPGDKCTMPDCDGILQIDLGQPLSYQEPEIAPVVFCESCGCEYLPDWTRIETK